MGLDFTTFKNVINGKLVDGKNTRHGINPATKVENPKVPVATQEDLDNAVKAARAAFPAWSKTSFAERSQKLNDYANAIMGEKEGFAKLLTQEQGKPLSAAKDEIDAGWYWVTEIAKMEVKDEVAEDTDDRQVIIRHTPLGICGAIVPWNFPIHLALGKIAPALISGNTIIIKPSPFTPYCNIKLVELAQQFFPPGVIQVLSGDDNLGPWITAHPDIDKISFTGSTFTGKKVMESCAKTLKRVTLELGGNDPAIVTANADVATMAPAVTEMAFANSGQVCLAVKRIYIHESIFDKFRDAMVAHTKTMKFGDGTTEGTTHGPVQNSMQYERVKGFFEEIEKEGQKVAVGGKNPDDSPGYFIHPTIIDRPKDDSRIVVEEPFGPILPILSWKDEDEVIARANGTKMGLGASIWTTDMEEARRIASQIQAGSVWVNSHLELNPKFPFGGHKESGIGHEWSLSGIKSFCNAQTLYLKKRV